MRVESLESVERVDSVIVESSDSVTITKTVTITVSEAGDTLKQDIFTDRLCIRDRAQLKVKSEKVKVVRDTVYINESSEFRVERLEPVERVQSSKSSMGSIVQGLRWVFWIIVAIGGLIITITITKTIRR